MAAINDEQTTNATRLTFWPHRGGNEWLEYRFESSRIVRRVVLHWFDDTGRGECRTPQSWRLLYRDSDKWKPVDTSDQFTSDPVDPSTVTFVPISTSALRVEIVLRDGYSAGVREWRVD